MPGTDLAIPDHGFGKNQLPAHLRHLAEQPSQIVTGDRQSGDSLGIKGKVFAITKDGETTPLMRMDKETGEESPMSTLPVVVLDYAVKTGRAYFASAYDPNEAKGPTCYSLDSVVPEADSEEIQSSKCATCQWAQKGSNVTDRGKATVACAAARILAVVPVKAMDSVPPLRLKLAQTSNYDGKSPEARQQGKYAFSNYLDSLKSRGIPTVNSVVTLLSFDKDAPHPKLFFKAQRYVDDAEHAQIQAILDAGKTEDILGWTSTKALAEGRGHRPDADAPREPGQHPADAALAKAGAANPALNKAPADEDDEDRLIREAQARKAAKAKAAAEAEAKRKAEEAAAQAAAKAPAAATQTVGAFVAPEMEEGEDEDDYNIRVASARKAHRLAEAAAMQAKAAAPAPAAEFKAPAMEEGEDEDDYAVRVAQARKAWKAKQAAPVEVVAEKKAPPVFVAPEQDEDEDEDDYAVRVAQARKAHKAKHGAPAAAPAAKAEAAKPAAKATAEAAEPPKRTRRTKEQIAADKAAAETAKAAPKAEAFLPEEAAKAKTMASLGDDEGDEEFEAAPTQASAKAPIAATPAAAVPDDVSALLETWGAE